MSDKIIKPRKPRRLLILIAPLIFIGALAWMGSTRRPTGAAAGDSLFGTVTAKVFPHDTLRVVTFNIDGGVGKADQKLDLNRTAMAVKDFDLIGLQEVHGSLSGPDQGQILGTLTGLTYAFAPVEQRWGYDAFGNGVLSDLPVTHWQRFPLATAVSATNRNVLLVRALWQGRPVTFLITHLDRHEDHDLELRSVTDLFLALNQPVVLLADLNTDKHDPILKQLQSTPGVVDCLSEKAADGVLPDNVDWIFARGLHCVAAGFSDNGASDHHMAWAELSDIRQSPSTTQK